MISATLTAVGVDKTTKWSLQLGFKVEHFISLPKQHHLVSTFA
jgi:hypothetical protein